MSHLSPADVDYVREVVREASAIVLDLSKTYLVESRLAPIARQVGAADLGDLVSRLRKDHTGKLRDMVVDAMTTNETSFYRDPTLWAALEEAIIPQLVQARSAQRALTFWSAASSSGQEAYSLAMLLKDRFPQLASWNVRIIATDLSADMLGRAASGRYTQLEVNRGLPVSRLVRYFERDGSYWRIRDEIRSMVEFRALNLVRPWPFVPYTDVLFLRNVLIYFDLKTKQEILARCRSVLKPDGHLVLGTSETTMNIDPNFTRLVTGTATTYRPA
ncbi:MAG: CheR family methyltransferase [Nitriliruptoraceae bacterium]